MRFSRSTWATAALVAGAIGAASMAVGCGGDDSTTTGGTGTTSATTTSSAPTGGPTGSGGAGGGSATTSTSTSTTGGGTVPDPGDAMGAEWTDIEPNEAPSDAVPVGILAGPVWAGFVQPYTAINPEDDVDYFVFKTGDAASLANVYVQLCWSFAGNLLDMDLYEVTGGQQGALVKSSTDTAPGCETLIASGEGGTVLAPTTVYLLKVYGPAGLALNGDPGLYSA